MSIKFSYQMCFFTETGRKFHTPGLDTYFFLNLAVGQPSNNMDLSAIKIYLGILIIFSFFAFHFKMKNKKSRCTLYFRIIVFETRCHVTNHSRSCLEVYFCPFFTQQGPEKNIGKLSIGIQNFERSRIYYLYSTHVMPCHSHCCMLQKL